MGFKSKLGNIREFAVNSMIYKSFYEDIDESLVYLESRDGLDFTGNIFRIVEELSAGNYGDLKIHVHAKPDVADKIKEYQKHYNLKIDKIITKESLATKTLEKAKYIFTDSGIRPKYVKKSGQIFVNTWHGTPLKLMGKYNIPEEYRLGQVQYVLMSSDYLLYPNDYMMDKMLDSYIIDKIYSGQILLEGYPRNSVFFDNEKRNKFKSIFNLENKEIFIYMPTFRGIFMDRDDETQKEDVEKYLSQLDVNLKDNQVLFAKLHVLNAKNIDFSKFKHIVPFPEGYETYDILNMADSLITDYSSVFFDFANTGRKIILFNYDEEEYESYRGFYFPLSELPFPKVQSIDDLVFELNSPKYYDDSEFLTKFCTYDRPDAVKYLCNHIFNNNKTCHAVSVNNKKENILIFAGALLKNNITSSLKNLLSNVDLERYNFFITFKQWDENIIQNHEEIINDLPENVGFLPLRYDLALTLTEKNAYNKFFSSQKQTQMSDVLKRAFKRAYDRNFYSFNFKRIIDFEGYNKNESLMFAYSGVKNAIWVHNDMLQEIHNGNIQNLNVWHEIYTNFDDVCVVSKDLIPSTIKISNKSDNIRIIPNINNFTSVIGKSEILLEVDEDTVVFGLDIEDVLNKDSMKFVSIGGFALEGYKHLISAFNKFSLDYPDTQLIIIGKNGELFDETCNMVKNNDNITLIKNISDPMPIFKNCSFLILSSYESEDIVLIEADTLIITSIFTDVLDIQWLKNHGGNIVENSEEGILKGMCQVSESILHTLNITSAEFNNEIINDFYQLLDEN